MATRIEATTLAKPMARLGPPSRMPRFRWQQPIPDHAVPPARGLTAAEREHEFVWAADSILPYAVFDDYDRDRPMRDMPVVVIDNGRLRATVAPHLGGRLLSLTDHTRGRELLFHNPVFQPANLGALDAWFSGGIEWNGLIPGHTPFTCARVFAGLVETPRGPLLRLYEFDRIVEATWQIDLFLPSGDDRLFVHGRIVNADPVDKLAYWWTNAAVPLMPGMRIFGPADDAIEHVLPGNELARFPYPDPERFDGSYPERSAGATSVFLRKPGAQRLYIAALDREGVGLAQTATATMTGRKFFFFGSGRGGRHWMDFLARDGEGRYVELQSGLAPTQNQRFRLPAEGVVSWTEVYGGIAVEPGQIFDDYRRGEGATAAVVEARFPEAELAGMHAFLAQAASEPVTRRFSEGAPWGARQEELTGRRLAPGLDFSVGESADLWDDIVHNAPFSSETLARTPAAFAVSPAWVDALEGHAKRHGRTWLHDLLLGIAALDRGDKESAGTLFRSSVAANPSWLGLRQFALVAETGDEREARYLAAWCADDPPPELAVEIAQFLLRSGRTASLREFIDTLPGPIQAHERIRLARASLAAAAGDLDGLEAFLAEPLATIREGEQLTESLWHALQEGRLTAGLGRTPHPEELAARLAAHPLPDHLDFRMLGTERSDP